MACTLRKLLACKKKLISNRCRPENLSTTNSFANVYSFLELNHYLLPTAENIQLYGSGMTNKLIMTITIYFSSVQGSGSPITLFFSNLFAVKIPQTDTLLKMQQSYLFYASLLPSLRRDSTEFTHVS